jgi:TRAP transporter TatT component family protein
VTALVRVLQLACAIAFAIQTPSADDPDELYRHRDDLARAARAADLWAQRGTDDYEAVWKLARVCYWLGTHAPERARRGALERGVAAGETAIRLGPTRPEGHFWLAANMGTLAETLGIVQGLRYRGRIKEELLRVLAIDAAWQGGSAEAALGRWYYEVPRLLGGSASKAEDHLRRALAYDAQNLVALSCLADVLASSGRRREALLLLQQILDAPLSTEWAEEDREFKQQAAERLRSLSGRR